VGPQPLWTQLPSREAIPDHTACSLVLPEWKAGFRAARYSKLWAVGGNAVVRTALGSVALSAGSVARAALRRSLGGCGCGESVSCPGSGDVLTLLVTSDASALQSPPRTAAAEASPSASLVHSSSSSPGKKKKKKRFSFRDRST
jgi:hypothetical protein